MKRLFSFFGVLALLALSSVGIYAQVDQTIAEVVAEAADADEAEFTTLLGLLDAAELVDVLDDADAEFTVFAPTDAAFAALLEESDVSLDDLLDDTDALTSILLYHVIEGEILSDDFEDEMALETLNGTALNISLGRRNTVIINEAATIVGDEIVTANGVIHVIDAVLSPPSASAGGECTVSTSDADTVRVRVGPGENRTSVTFLPANQEFVVQGQTEDDDGNVWFQLNKEEAAPGRAINEAWIAADDVDSDGACDNIAAADAPPIIPITSNRPSSSGGGGGTVGGTGSIWIDYPEWAAQLPSDLAAPSRGQARIIVQATDELVNEQICGTYFYTNDPTRTTTVRRYQIAVNVTVINARTGAVLGSQQFIGGQAPACPSRLAINATLNGPKPPLSDALPFILGF